jgi:hypothetical protein
MAHLSWIEYTMPYITRSDWIVQKSTTRLLTSFCRKLPKKIIPSPFPLYLSELEECIRISNGIWIHPAGSAQSRPWHFRLPVPPRPKFVGNTTAKTWCLKATFVTSSKPGDKRPPSSQECLHYATYVLYDYIQTYVDYGIIQLFTHYADSNTACLKWNW